MDKKDWLTKFADLLGQNPDVHLFYTTSDDGVWLRYGSGRDEEICLGFDGETAIKALRAAVR